MYGEVALQLVEAGSKQKTTKRKMKAEHDDYWNPSAACIMPWNGWLTGSASSSIFTDLGCIPKPNCLSGELFWCVVFCWHLVAKFLEFEPAMIQLLKITSLCVRSSIKWLLFLEVQMGFCSAKQLKWREMTFTAPIMPMKLCFYIFCLHTFRLDFFCSSEKLQWWPQATCWRDSIHRHISCDMDFCRCFLVKKTWLL